MKILLLKEDTQVGRENNYYTTATSNRPEATLEVVEAGNLGQRAWSQERDEVLR